MLEPRDQVLEHNFSFDCPVSLSGPALHEWREDLLCHIHSFLVETASNVISVAFRFLCEGQLEELEAKEYASKNLMLNVHAIFRQAVRAIEEAKLLQEVVALEEFKAALAT
jgi:hypothetical protein